MLRKEYPDFDPILRLVEIAQTSLDESVVIDCCKAIAPYMHAKLKNVEIKTNVESNVVQKLLEGRERARLRSIQAEKEREDKQQQT